VKILYLRVNDDDDDDNSNNNNITWNTKSMTPITNGATGIVTKCLKKHFEAILGKHSVDLLHKTAMLGTYTLCGKYCSLKLKA
jgi:hypothetical protein